MMQVCSLTSECGLPYGWYAYGHVDKDDFLQVVAEEYQFKGQRSDVRHIHARWVPAPSSAEWDLEFRESKPGRGAFACTFLRAE